MKMKLLKEGRKQNEGLDPHKPNTEKLNCSLERKEVLALQQHVRVEYWAKTHRVVYKGMISDAIQIIHDSRYIV